MFRPLTQLLSTPEILAHNLSQLYLSFQFSRLFQNNLSRNDEEVVLCGFIIEYLSTGVRMVYLGFSLAITIDCYTNTNPETSIISRQRIMVRKSTKIKPYSRIYVYLISVKTTNTDASNITGRRLHSVSGHSNRSLLNLVLFYIVGLTSQRAG